MCYLKQHGNEHFVDLILQVASRSDPKALCGEGQVNTGKCAVQGQVWEMVPYSFQIPSLEGNMSVHVGKRREREKISEGGWLF